MPYSSVVLIAVLGCFSLQGCNNWCGSQTDRSSQVSRKPPADKPLTVIGSWQVLSGCEMSNGMRVEARVRGTGSRKLYKSFELAELIKRYPLIDLPGVQGYSLGLCCFSDPRERLCLMFVLEQGAKLRRFVGAVDRMFSAQGLGIELTVLRDQGAQMQVAPDL